VAKGSVGGKRAVPSRWERLARSRFDFVLDHGFRFDRSSSSFWQESVSYRAPEVGLDVILSIEFDCVDLELLRLDGGQRRPADIWIVDGKPIGSVPFENVLLARSSDPALTSPQLANVWGASDDELLAELDRLAIALRTVAPDFLAGSVAAIDDGERVIRARVADDPQVMTVWLPDDASQQDHDEARRTARLTTPPEVGVDVKTYRRANRAPRDSNRG
jgi:hypothetical protein